MTDLWVVAVTDHFGPTAYLAPDDLLVWSDDERHKAIRFSTAEIERLPLAGRHTIMRASALNTLRRGERK